MNEQIARVISGAIAAAGPLGTAGNQYDWEQRIIAALPVVASLFDEGGMVAQRAEWFDNAHIYVGLFMDVRLEESSQRLVLRTDPERTKNGQPEIDEIRTDRIDTVIGKRQKALLDACQPGDKLLIWRVNEPMKTDAMKNVRVAYLIKRIGRAQQSAGGTPSPAGGRAAVTPVPAAPSAPASHPPGGRGSTVVDDLMKQITRMPPGTKQKLIAEAVKRRLAISSRMSEDEAHAVFLLLPEIEQDRGEEPDF
jgi:hypothetical protein